MTTSKDVVKMILEHIDDIDDCLNKPMSVEYEAEFMKAKSTAFLALAIETKSFQ